jgi:hypothetical protein
LLQTFGGTIDRKSSENHVISVLTTRPPAMGNLHAGIVKAMLYRVVTAEFCFPPSKRPPNRHNIVAKMVCELSATCLENSRMVATESLSVWWPLGGRPRKSCDQCAHNKTSCDGESPCGNCKSNAISCGPALCWQWPTTSLRAYLGMTSGSISRNLC